MINRQINCSVLTIVSAALAFSFGSAVQPSRAAPIMETQVVVCPPGAACVYEAVGSASVSAGLNFSPYGNYTPGEGAPVASVSGGAIVNSDGSLGAIISAAVRVPMDYSGANAAIAAWGQAFTWDYLTVTAPGKTGTALAKITSSFHGSVYSNPALGLPGPCFSLTDGGGATISTSGSCLAPSTGYSGAVADAYYDIAVNGATIFQNYSAYFRNYSVLNHPTVTYLVPITFGTQFELEQELAAYVFVQAGSYGSPFDGPANANATSDFADTAQISQIQLFDNNGDPIPGFVISSTSGLRYTQEGISAPTSVPEPSSFAIVVAGIGLIGAGSIARKRVHKDI